MRFYINRILYYKKNVEFTLDNYIKYYTNYVIKAQVREIAFYSIFFLTSHIFIFSLLLLSHIYSIRKNVKRINIIKNNINNISQKERKILEKDLANTKYFYYGWYLTENYLFNIDIFQKIEYKDIIIVEELATIAALPSNDYVPNVNTVSITSKETLYLKNGNKFKITFFHNKEKEFKSFLKEKNPDIFFGIKEDYKSLNE